MTFHDLSLTFPSFPWSKLKHLFWQYIHVVLKQSFNTIFSSIIIHKMHAWHRLYWNESLFPTCLLFFKFLNLLAFLFSERILFFHDFPWPSLAFHIPWLYRPGNWNHHFPGFPWPVQSLVITLTHKNLIQ